MITHHAPYPAVTKGDVQDSSESTKLLRKLRWIGHDEEARRLEEALRGFVPGEGDSVLSGPISNDEAN
jgi:hypothetical protein